MQSRSEADRIRAELATLRERLENGGVSRAQYVSMSARLLHRLKTAESARHRYAKT
jgi:hypothetical protein